MSPRLVFAILLYFSACTRAPVVVESPPETLAPPKPPPPTPKLVAAATLPALTFGEGPPSGARVGASFATQPIQGFSGLIALEDGGFLATSDNGYGAPETSADYLLRVYAVQADFDAGTLAPSTLFTLRDPDRKVPWPIVNHFTAERLLTGADLDPESFVRAPDGTFWFGDEHGPFLVHTDETGRLLDEPIPLTGGDAGVLRGPDNPFLRENLMLRSLEALNAYAAAHDAGTPIASPDHKWLASREQVQQLHKAGFRVVPWTVNDVDRMAELAGWGVDGLITDRPDLAGAVRDAGLDVQGHRGARGLAPENTRAAFQAGLAAGASTLELDVTALSDGTLLVWHDPNAVRPKCHGMLSAITLPLPRLSPGALKNVVCDGTLAELPEQRADGKPADYKLMTLADVLKLRSSGSKELPKLNVETKVHGTGAPEDDPRLMTRSLAEQVLAAKAGSRVTLQSFDWRALTTANAEYPWLQTVALFGDRSARGDDESRAGLPWPQVGEAPVVKRSGGFENLAMAPDGRTLYAMLEKPLGDSRECLAFAFDLATKQYTGLAFRFPLHERATAIGDITMEDATHGYAIERDDSEGQPDGYKRVIRFTLPSTPGGLVTRETAIDLLALPMAGGTFTFPFITIEGIAVLPGGRLAIVNDNNLPFGRARSPDAPDGTELIIVGFDR